MNSSRPDEIQTIYHQFIEAWNSANARAMADLFMVNGEIIGYDGSQEIGRENIFSHLAPIFISHPTSRFVGKVKSIRFLGSNIAMLRAIAGMISRGQSDLNPNINTHHTLIAENNERNWRILLFQNTRLCFMEDPSLLNK